MCSLDDDSKPSSPAALAIEAWSRTDFQSSEILLLSSLSSSIACFTNSEEESHESSTAIISVVIKRSKPLLALIWLCAESRGRERSSRPLSMEGEGV